MGLDTQTPSMCEDIPVASQQWALIGRLSETGESCCTIVSSLPFCIGRRGELALTLGSRSVSGSHAELFESEGKLAIRDLNSTNGTFVNGERIYGERELVEEDLIQIADLPFRLSSASPRVESRTLNDDVCDHALALVQLDTLLEKRAITPFYQPIVDLLDGETIAFEALARSRLIGLETPAAIFSAASQLGVEADVSRLMRVKAIQKSASFAHWPHLFLNTHPAELAQKGFHNRLAEMRSLAPFQPLTLEIHEAALMNVGMMIDLRVRLEHLDIQLAFDDFGAGQARIAEIAEVRPHIVKFDRVMIKDIDTADSKRKGLISGLVNTLHDIGVTALAEGVETAGESAACKAIGFQLAQGFHFGRPAPPKSYASTS